MRNILGERVLGLPGDVRVDRDVAWKDVPRNYRQRTCVSSGGYTPVC